MTYLIRRRDGVTREELIAHWFANHMPEVIRRQQLQASTGKLAATRYIATLFDPDASVASTWDGMAQLWFPEALPQPKAAIGTRPTDSFQERAEPYLPWATTEHVIVDGDLPVSPLTLNPPFPTTRSGFCKVTLMIVLREDADREAFLHQWLHVHLPSVRTTMEKAGGFRYTIGISSDPANAPYVGMAELYFPNTTASGQFFSELPPDGTSDYYDHLELYTSTTEMIGIP
jgi:hypothetical protein